MPKSPSGDVPDLTTVTEALALLTETVRAAATEAETAANHAAQVYPDDERDQP